MATIAASVVKYLEDNKGSLLHAVDAAKDLGITEKQWSSTISTLRRRSGFDIEKVGSGAFVYHGKKAAPGGTLFEQIAVTKTGILILQDEDGAIYRANRLD